MIPNRLIVAGATGQRGRNGFFSSPLITTYFAVFGAVSGDVATLHVPVAKPLYL